MKLLRQGSRQSISQTQNLSTATGMQRIKTCAWNCCASGASVKFHCKIYYLCQTVQPCGQYGMAHNSCRLLQMPCACHVHEALASRNYAYALHAWMKHMFSHLQQCVVPVVCCCVCTLSPTSRKCTCALCTLMKRCPAGPLRVRLVLAWAICVCVCVCVCTAYLEG